MAWVVCHGMGQATDIQPDSSDIAALCGRQRHSRWKSARCVVNEGSGSRIQVEDFKIQGEFQNALSRSDGCQYPHDSVAAWRRGDEATRRGDGLRAQWPNRAASQVANTPGVTPARLRACQLTRATRCAHGFRGNRAIRSALFNGIPQADALPPGRKSAQFFNQARNDLSRNVAVVGCAEVVLHCDLRGHAAGLYQHPIALRPGVFCA